MVILCNGDYSLDSESKYCKYFEKYSFPLSSFQKYAIEAIVEGHHVLSCVPTGSGKTLGAEFAIEYFALNKKRTIYTSPIKALSNQKYHEFTNKFPHISFGIITGDIKTNPEADVLIMTTEILMNSLYAHRSCTKQSGLSSFEMDFNSELECVIFDEVHMIGDENRGHVWEETILMMPSQVQMVMLSATLDSPEKFASWCETKGDSVTAIEKQVYLSSSHNRIVPLTHYSFITCTQGIFKKIKDKEIESEINNTINKPLVIQDSEGIFNIANYQKINRTLERFSSKQHYVKRQHALNTVAKYMVENAMLPAICFVLSRKALEQCANEMTTVLLEDDSKTPYTVKSECEHFIRKLPNYSEYLNLPEFHHIVALLEKGVAIHHAGMMPVLRELVELLFAKGHIKLLFATETFSIGINMPAKTTLFVDMNKFDGNRIRPLYPHEYTQMAGRAGRRGIDSVGHVIHLTNLFKEHSSVSLKYMMKGKPQALCSQFKIGYNLMLNLINMEDANYTEYSNASMFQKELDNKSAAFRNANIEIGVEISKMEDMLVNSRVNIEIVEEYIMLKIQRQNVVNKKRKDIDKKINTIMNDYKNIENDVARVTSLMEKRKLYAANENDVIDIQNHIQNQISTVIKFMEEREFVRKNEQNKTTIELTSKGNVGANIRELHCLVFANIIELNMLDNLSTTELVGLFSCFTNVSIPKEESLQKPSSNNIKLNKCIEYISDMYNNYKDLEVQNNIRTGIDYNMHYDLIRETMQWCECSTDVDCKTIIQNLQQEKSVFLGEFIKALLKINNISAEMEKVAELVGSVSLLHKLKSIPEQTLKYVATNQSLYV